MFNSDQGRRIKIGEDRRLVLDVLHFARNMPCVPIDKYMDLRELARQREAAAVLISWPVLFIKAYALAVVDVPQLRRSYIRWPRPYLYEHTQSVASVAVHRRYRRGNLGMERADRRDAGQRALG